MATQLPPAWKENFDPSSARKYYVNHQTRQTSWTLPSESPLPAGWEQRFDPKGRVFFVNHDEGTTTWTDPRDQNTAPAPAPANTGPVSSPAATAPVKPGPNQYGTGTLVLIDDGFKNFEKNGPCTESCDPYHSAAADSTTTKGYGHSTQKIKDMKTNTRHKKKQRKKRRGKDNRRGKKGNSDARAKTGLGVRSSYKKISSAAVETFAKLQDVPSKHEDALDKLTNKILSAKRSASKRGDVFQSGRKVPPAEQTLAKTRPNTAESRLISLPPPVTDPRAAGEDHPPLAAAGAAAAPARNGHSPGHSPVPSPGHSTCSICLFAEADHVIIPCGHQCGCKSCLSRVTQCPICRGPINNVLCRGAVDDFQAVFEVGAASEDHAPPSDAGAAAATSRNHSRMLSALNVYHRTEAHKPVYTNLRNCKIATTTTGFDEQNFNGLITDPNSISLITDPTHPDHSCWKPGLSLAVKGSTPFKNKSYLTHLHYGMGEDNTHDWCRILCKTLVHPQTNKILGFKDIMAMTFYKCQWSVDGSLLMKNGSVKEVEMSGVADGCPKVMKSEDKAVGWRYLTLKTNPLCDTK